MLHSMAKRCYLWCAKQRFEQLTGTNRAGTVEQTCIQLKLARRWTIISRFGTIGSYNSKPEGAVGPCTVPVYHRWQGKWSGPRKLNSFQEGIHFGSEDVTRWKFAPGFPYIGNSQCFLPILNAPYLVSTSSHWLLFCFIQ